MDRSKATPESYWPRTLVVLMALVAVGGFVLTELTVTGGVDGLPLDDSWIHLGFARGLAEGQGLAFDGDRWVGGSTGPLWTAILALVFVLPGSPIVWSKLLSVACFVGAVVGMKVLARQYGLSLRWAVFCSLSLAVTDWMIWSALSAMEISLFVLLSTWALALYETDRRRGTHSAWLPLSLSCLVRPEGLLLLGLAAAERLVTFRRRRQQLPVDTSRDAATELVASAGRPRSVAFGLGLAAVVLVPVAIFHLVAHGSPFPTTLGVKTGESHQLIPDWRDLWRSAEVLFRPQPVVFALAAAGSVEIFRRLGGVGQRALLPLLWLLTLPLAYSALSAAGSASNLGNFGRYLFPLFVPLVLLGGLGLARLAEPLERVRVRGWRLDLSWLVLVLALVPAGRSAWTGAQRYALNVSNVAESDVAAARFIADSLPPEARLAVQDIGAIGYLTENPLIDMVGILNPEISPFLTGDRAGSHPTGLGGLFEFLRAGDADFLVLFPSSYGGWESLQAIEPGLGVVHRIQLDHNITMAGSELAILLAPWSKYAPTEAGTAPPPG